MFDFANENGDDAPLCGIDEAGRGPLAGPMAMAGVIITKGISGLNDSKKLSEKRREGLFDEIVQSCVFHLVIFDNTEIDRKGLSACLKEGLEDIRDVMAGYTDRFLFDGRSNYGAYGIATMVKADAKVKEVSAASIVAKVFRDRMMRRYAALYRDYGFERNKGYGTRGHLAAIEKHGFTPLHRRSFSISRLVTANSHHDDRSLFETDQ